MNQNRFNILAIDGGGIRGIFPAHILKRIEEELKINIHNYFDMIAGTSTGSIVASAVACNIPLSKVVALYCEHGNSIFSKNKSWLPVSCVPKKFRQSIKSKYTNTPLKNLLLETFGITTLGQIKKPLILPATDIGLGGVHIFKSSYSPAFIRDKNVPVYEAILASCSAPTFFDPTKVNEYLLADGGLWANNPSLAAIIDAQRRMNIPLENIRVFSVGTGHAKISYSMDTKRKWGLMNGWRGSEFISFLMSLQAESTQNYVQLILEKHQLLRLNFESDSPLPLDDCSYVDDLIARADKKFTHQFQEIKDFFNVASRSPA